MEFYEKTITSKEIFSGKILKVRFDEVELPGGRRSTREVVEHSGGVCIIAITDADEILLVEQYRKPPEEVMLEIPAGKLEEDEDPLTCASRELVEETGYRAEKIDHIFSFYTTPGYSDELLHLFLARDLQEVGSDPDQDEIIRLKKISKEDIINFIIEGDIKDGKTIVGLFSYLSYLRGELEC